MNKKRSIFWKIFAVLMLAAQMRKIYLSNDRFQMYSLGDIFDWVMSFPECVVVCLFVAKFAIGSPAWWRAFAFIYPVYAFYVVWVCVKLYLFLFIPAGHPIPYGISLVIVIAMKVFSTYAIWQYGREPDIWRKAV